MQSFRFFSPPPLSIHSLHVEAFQPATSSSSSSSDDLSRSISTARETRQDDLRLFTSGVVKQFDKSRNIKTRRKRRQLKLVVGLHVIGPTPARFSLFFFFLYELFSLFSLPQPTPCYLDAFFFFNFETKLAACVE